MPQSSKLFFINTQNTRIRKRKHTCKTNAELWHENEQRSLHIKQITTKTHVWHEPVADCWRERCCQAETSLPPQLHVSSSQRQLETDHVDSAQSPRPTVKSHNSYNCSTQHSSSVIVISQQQIDSIFRGGVIQHWKLQQKQCFVAAVVVLELFWFRTENSVPLSQFWCHRTGGDHRGIRRHSRMLGCHWHHEQWRISAARCVDVSPPASQTFHPHITSSLSPW